MIKWPDEKKIRSEGREGLQHFRESAAAAELESSKETWTITAWPWTTEPPVRVSLQNQAQRSVTVSLAEGGIWLVSDDPRSVHERTTEELDRDARGLPGQRPRQPSTEA